MIRPEKHKNIKNTSEIVEENRQKKLVSSH